MATYNSNLVAAGQGSPSVLPGAAKAIYGSVTLAAGTLIAVNDTIPLFSLGAASALHITGWTIDSGPLDAGATLTLSLLDSNTTPTTLINASTGFRAGAVLTQATAIHGTFGQAIGYTAPSLIYLKGIAAATTAIAAQQVVYFVFEVARD